jgi:2-polyprenyl-3-methyl-5-hydroxy-6-metoxy-1,4-benzoquinol methylase
VPVPNPTTVRVFDDQQRAWREYTASPWARIRYAVVAETLRRNLDALDQERLRVLDVGGGDGLDALPLAQAGHDVTLLDPSEPMLAHARECADRLGVADRVRTVRGSLDDLASLGDGWDVVLCHFVLRYRPADAVDVPRLVAAVRPGGVLSVLDANPAGTVLGRAARQGPAAALDLLHADRLHSVVFGEDTRKITDTEMRKALEDAGCEVIAQYGGRVVNDLLTDDEAKQDPGYFDDLLRLELALCDREPFNRIGQFWQVVATRI